LKKEIEREGGEAEIFSLDVYDYPNINEVFRNIRKTWPQSRLSFACWNTGAWSMIPFMEIQERDIQNSVDINIVAATCFAQNAVEWFIEPTLLSRGENTTAPGGTLIFTGATSALRGSASFGAFAAGKHGLRALSQSIAREFGPQGVHVSFVVVDGTIRTKSASFLLA
jgi:short-subunit dehydrogenase